jgi:hypothetical protein
MMLQKADIKNLVNAPVKIASGLLSNLQAAFV